MKVKRALIQEGRDLIREGRLEEARVLAAYIRLLKAIFRD